MLEDGKKIQMSVFLIKLMHLNWYEKSLGEYDFEE